MNENINIDELLNGFIDGQLSQRQQTEVHRLTAHDPKIAKRLAELKNCKMLLGSLPHAEAPPHIAEQIKASLERRALLSHHGPDFEHTAGARHLFIRKVLTAAAMLGLVAVLAGVIYTIVGPEPKPEKTFVSDQWTRPPAHQLELEEPAAPVADIEKTVVKTPLPAAVPPIEFIARLEIKTTDFVAVDAFIKRAIEESGLLEYTGPADRVNKNLYVLSCSTNTLNSILADLQDVWHRFDSATLFIETGSSEGELAVVDVKPEQIVEIANQKNIKRRIETANNFTFLNNMNTLLPGRELLAAVEHKEPEIINIPKPVLTSNHKTVKRQTAKTEQDKDVYLTVVITSANRK